jgi:hypothetical protein
MRNLSHDPVPLRTFNGEQQIVRVVGTVYLRVHHHPYLHQPPHLKIFSCSALLYFILYRTYIYI